MNRLVEGGFRVIWFSVQTGIRRGGGAVHEVGARPTVSITYVPGGTQSRHSARRFYGELVLTACIHVLFADNCYAHYQELPCFHD